MLVFLTSTGCTCRKHPARTHPTPRGPEPPGPGLTSAAAPPCVLEVRPRVAHAAAPRAAVVAPPADLAHRACALRLGDAVLDTRLVLGRVLRPWKYRTRHSRSDQCSNAAGAPSNEQRFTDKIFENLKWGEGKADVQIATTPPQYRTLETQRRVQTFRTCDVLVRRQNMIMNVLRLACKEY